MFYHKNLVQLKLAYLCEMNKITLILGWYWAWEIVELIVIQYLPIFLIRILASGGISSGSSSLSSPNTDATVLDGGFRLVVALSFFEKQNNDINKMVLRPSTLYNYWVPTIDYLLEKAI